MAKEASLCLLFLSFLITSSSGTLVGFAYHERGNSVTSTSAGTISFLQKTKLSPSQIRILVTDHRILSTLSLNSNVSVDFYLNKTLVEKFITSEPSATFSWLKAHIVNFLPQVDIKSIIVSCSSECFTENEIPLRVSALKSVHLALRKLHLAREVKVSVALPLSFLEKLNASYENDLSRILSFIKEIKSFVTIEDSIDGELSMGNHFVPSITKRVTLAASILPRKDVPLVMTIKSSVIPSSREVAQFSDKVSQFLGARTEITKIIAALYAEVHIPEDFSQIDFEREEDELFPESSRRVILSKLSHKRILDDTTNPTTTSGTTPIITTPDTPTIITVPSTTNPVTISPSNPATMPVPIPSTTPVPLPPTNPANSPVPVTNPATTPNTVPGATTPATNPVTSYPPPSSGSVPVVNQQPPPATANSPPATQGQSWCVAKNGAPESALQAALDYACGMGGADCSQIQQGGSCYSPVTLQNHASNAFNSYYQKHPGPTSCDFGGTATLVSTNPSSGSCIFPSSSSSTSTSSSPTTPTPSISSPPPNPTTPPPSTPSIPTAPPTTSSSTSGSGTSGYGTPPSVLNSSNPASSSSSGGTMPTGFGFQTPPDVNTTSSSSSHSVTHTPLVGYIVLAISFITARLSLRP